MFYRNIPVGLSTFDSPLVIKVRKVRKDSDGQQRVVKARKMARRQQRAIKAASLVA